MKIFLKSLILAFVISFVYTPFVSFCEEGYREGPDFDYPLPHNYVDPRSVSSPTELYYLDEPQALIYRGWLSDNLVNNDIYFGWRFQGDNERSVYSPVDDPWQEVDYPFSIPGDNEWSVYSPVDDPWQEVDYPFSIPTDVYVNPFYPFIVPQQSQPRTKKTFTLEVTLVRCEKTMFGIKTKEINESYRRSFEFIMESEPPDDFIDRHFTWPSPRVIDPNVSGLEEGYAILVDGGLDEYLDGLYEMQYRIEGEDYNWDWHKYDPKNPPRYSKPKIYKVQLRIKKKSNDEIIRSTTVTSEISGAPLLVLSGLIYNFDLLGGAIWIIWGCILLAQSLKDKNGPGLQSGTWQIVGGIMIMIAANLFKNMGDDANILGEVFRIAQQFSMIGGALWTIWGVIILASALKEKTGPQLNSAIWQIVGGIMVMCASNMFQTLIKVG